MPKKPASTRLERAFSALIAALERTGVPFMVIGGVAVIAHGVKRLTTDVDAVVQGDAVDIDALLRGLARAGIEPRIDDVARFARANLVLLLRHEATGVELDVSLGFTRFELEALDSRRMARFGGTKAPMAGPEDLIIFKALAARPKDVGDATALLVMHPGVDLARIRSRVAELAELAEAPELTDGLEAIIASALAAGRRAPARARSNQPGSTQQTPRKRRPNKKKLPSKGRGKN